jgi:hypothetical protein
MKGKETVFDIFTILVYPVVLKYAAMRLRDPELQAIALVLAWYSWKLYQGQGKADLPPSVWARIGVRHALAGRDLPGVKEGKFRDVWDNRIQWQGAGMQKTIDRRAFPADRILAAQEELQALIESTDERGRELIDMIDSERLSTNQIASRMRISPAAVSQRRRKLMESME